MVLHVVLQNLLQPGERYHASTFHPEREEYLECYLESLLLLLRMFQKSSIDQKRWKGVQTQICLR